MPRDFKILSYIQKMIVFSNYVQTYKYSHFRKLNRNKETIVRAFQNCLECQSTNIWKKQQTLTSFFFFLQFVSHYTRRLWVYFCFSSIVWLRRSRVYFFFFSFFSCFVWSIFFPHSLFLHINSGTFLKIDKLFQIRVTVTGLL